LAPSTAATVLAAQGSSTVEPTVVAVAATEPVVTAAPAEPRPVGYVGVVTCPTSNGDSVISGYTRWDDLVHDVNHLIVNGTTIATVATFTLCPHQEHDATHSRTLHVQQSHVTIACGATGYPQGCIVHGATIRIGDQLSDIILVGLEFTQPQGELYIGDASHVQINHCRFTEALFPGTTSSSKRAAVVSAGFLSMNDCLFARNIGQGAVLITARTAVIERTAFRHNRAAAVTAEEDQATGAACEHDVVLASAIQVGLAHEFDHRHNATLELRDSCFDDNYGPHIVRVQPGATLAVNRRNAVSNVRGNATCNGIFILRHHYNTIDEACQRFAFRNTTCAQRSSSAGSISDDGSSSRMPTTVDSNPTLPSPSASPTVDFLAAFVPTNGGETEDEEPAAETETPAPSNSTNDDDAAVDDDGTNSTSTDDDDSVDDDDNNATAVAEDGQTWLDNLIDNLEQNETNDDAIVPLTDNYDAGQDISASRVSSCTRWMVSLSLLLAAMTWSI
jgi:hypothetical protein